MKNKLTLADKNNAVHSGFLLKRLVWAFFASGQLARLRFCLGFSHEEEKPVMEVWVSFFVLTSYEGVTPFFPGTQQTPNEGAVSLHPASLAAFSTHLSQEQFFGRTASPRPSAPLPWPSWQEEHAWMRDPIFTTRRQMPLAGEAEFRSQPAAPSREKLLCALTPQGLWAEGVWTLLVTCAVR